jgi:hypothetical protein
MGATGIAGFALLAVGLSLWRRNSYFHAIAVIKGKERQESAIDELAARICGRLTGTGFSPELMTSNGLRSLAVAIERKHGSAILTDKLIVEAIRAAAFDIEALLSGQELALRLQILDQLRLAFKDTGPPLLSIATVDRMYAYEKAQKAAGSIAFGVAILGLGATVLGASWLALVEVMAVAGLAVLAAGSERAARFWGIQPIGQDHSAELSIETRPVVDMFFSAAKSRTERAARFWHLTWAPIWENVFHPRFMRMHFYRVPYAEDLREELAREMKALERAADEKVDTGPQIQRIGQLFRRLWQVTGDDSFRSEARRILRAGGAPDPGVLEDLLQRAEASKNSLPNMRKDLQLKRKRFYTSVASHGAPAASDVALLKELVSSARVLWQTTGDDEIAKIAKESLALLERYEQTGHFFADDWNRK